MTEILNKKIEKTITAIDLLSEDKPTDFKYLLSEGEKKLSENEMLSPQLVDDNTSQKLEQAYIDGSLKNTGTIDIENIPQYSPDKQTCEILEDLFSRNQLESKKVKYLIDSIHMTDYFDEYSYEGRKFIRCKATIDQPDNIKLSNSDTIVKDNYYWIEVKPKSLLFDNNNYSNLGIHMSGRKI